MKSQSGSDQLLLLGDSVYSKTGGCNVYFNFFFSETNFVLSLVSKFLIDLRYKFRYQPQIGNYIPNNIGREEKFVSLSLAAVGEVDKTCLLCCSLGSR